MAGEIVVIDGVRYRIEEAEARGLIGERPVPGTPRALSLTAAQVDVDALVEARVRRHEAELEAAYAARVEQAVADALAAHDQDKADGGAAESDEQSDDTVEPEAQSADEAEKVKAAPAARTAKPRNKAAKPADK